MGTGSVRQAYAEASPLVVRLASERHVDPSEFHGGSGVAAVQHSGKRYNLGIFHHGSPYEEYTNWPYKFEADPPFRILEVGEKLPLKSAPNPLYRHMFVQFVSSISVHEGDVIIGYGVGDTHSHIFRMPLLAFEKLFFPM